MLSKKVLFGIGVVIGIVLFLILKPEPPIEVVVVEEEVVVEITDPRYSVIGKSVEGRDIGLYKFGEGEKNIAFIGGIHGGYEWNSVLLAYEFIDYFKANPTEVPEGITVNIIPVSNPDGLFSVTGKEGRFTTLDVSNSEDILAEGRFNSNGVDLNRNFACNWKPESAWRSRVVSAGSEAFSEPEAKAIKSFVELESPEAVIFWHSQASTVYASECNSSPLVETIDIMKEYAVAAKYNSVETFDAYEITGDAADWLSTIGIPAITVELTNHTDTDWEKNLSGVKSILNYYNK